MNLDSRDLALTTSVRAILRTDFGCGYFCDKNKLDFCKQLCRRVLEYVIWY